MSQLSLVFDAWSWRFVFFVISGTGDSSVSGLCRFTAMQATNADHVHVIAGS